MCLTAPKSAFVGNGSIANIDLAACKALRLFG
jgi:hypothetical protein